jgi:voltage-gated potassium channel
MVKDNSKKGLKGWRYRLHEIIFESDTKAGKAFDVALLWAIMISVATVSMESVREINARYGVWLRMIEWFFTGLFTIEYILRLFSVNKPLRYATSFYGIIDLLAIIPSYLGLFITGSQHFIIIRIIRLLRIFRILKLTQYVTEGYILRKALIASKNKILVFIFTVLTLVFVIGAMMYVIEGGENGFTSIPTSMYWSIVTLTTVGYGDISPQTPLGKFLASIVMILGYGIIAVPTGIVSVEIAQATRAGMNTQSCPGCGREGHDQDAAYCKYCGTGL